MSGLRVQPSVRAAALSVMLAFAASGSAGGAEPAPTLDYAAAAVQLDTAIIENYAYLDKLPGGILPSSPALLAERAAVSDARSLLHYAEDRIASLADHHASTGSSFAASWALVPTYADLWIVPEGTRYRIDAVRSASPAAEAGIAAGDYLDAVDGVATAQAVTGYWQRLGLDTTRQRAGYAARVLAAGRRDRARILTIRGANGRQRTLTLPNLYQPPRIDRHPVTISRGSGTTTIAFNNSLGDNNTIAAFDAAMADILPNDRLTIDLRDTPSGGNTSIARAVMGWFVDRPRFYQVHNSPREFRETGIARQWAEQVLPRAGKYRSQLPTVLVGRWTGSMGEGLAAGFAALGARVRGSAMAGLNGAIETLPVGNTNLTVQIPVERLTTVGGIPREDWKPAR